MFREVFQSPVLLFQPSSRNRKAGGTSTPRRSPSVQNGTPSRCDGRRVQSPITVNVNLPMAALSHSITSARMCFFYLAEQIRTTRSRPRGRQYHRRRRSITQRLRPICIPSTPITFSITFRRRTWTGTPLSRSFLRFRYPGNMVRRVKTRTSLPRKPALAHHQRHLFSTDMQIGSLCKPMLRQDGTHLPLWMNTDGHPEHPHAYLAADIRRRSTLVTGFCLDPSSTPTTPILWVSQTLFYAFPGRRTGQFHEQADGDDRDEPDHCQGCDHHLPALPSLDHGNDQPVSSPPPTICLCQAGERYGAPPNHVWQPPRPKRCSVGHLEVNTSALTVNSRQTCIGRAGCRRNIYLTGRRPPVTGTPPAWRRVCPVFDSTVQLGR